MGSSFTLGILIIYLYSITCTLSGDGHDSSDAKHYDYEALLSLSLHAICFIIQTLVIIHFYVKIRKPGRQISKTIKFAAIFVIMFVWIAILVDIAIGVLDFIVKIDFDIYCYTIYYMRYIRIILFEVVLSLFWIIRLNHTFKFSALEIKFRTFVIIFSLILLSSFGLSVVFVIMFNEIKNENIFYTKLQSFDTDDPNSKPMIEGNSCYIHWTSEVLYLLLASQFLILMENVGFALIFWNKLKSLHKIVVSSADLSSQSGQRVQKIYQLQQKHTLLAMIPLIVTFTCYALFDIANYFHLPLSTLYFLTNIDMIIKSISLILFFKFYARRFGQLCCCCIKCIGYTNDELFPYFDPRPKDNDNNDPEYKKPTIYAKVEKLNLQKQRRKERAKSIKKGIISEEEAALEETDSEDEYNVDASRSYHEPDEIIKHLTMPSSMNNPTHLVVKSNDYDDTDDEYPRSPKFSAMDMDPEDRIDPKHQAQACQWIEELMGIKINNKLPPKFSTIDENEEKDFKDSEEAKMAQAMAMEAHSSTSPSPSPSSTDLEADDSGDFYDKLKDGIILCKMLNKVSPGICKGYKRSKVAFVQRANLDIFIQGCRKLGVSEIDIMDTNDLFERQRLSSVLKTIFAISAKAKEIQEYDGPTIGFKYADKNERRFSKNTMSKAKTAVPFMTRPAIQMERKAMDNYGIIKV